MKKILITGAGGHLGCSLRELLNNRKDIEYVASDLVPSRKENIIALDLTDSEAVDNFISQGFDFVINCAAYTAVDKAEEQAELCRKVNVDAIRNIGAASKRFGAKVIHISTDYVFGGDGFRPYLPEDDVNPRSVYGATKLEGERALSKVMQGQDFAIIRTAWLYSIYGNNFVKTMLRLGSERDSLNVVADQIGSPTYAPDLANAIIRVIDGEKFIPGVYHFTNEGVASWFDFSKAIMEISGNKNCTVNPCTTEDYPTKACRPFYSVLSKKKIRDIYEVKIPYWRDSLKECIKLLTDNGFID